jgi:hypothetical protein
MKEWLGLERMIEMYSKSKQALHLHTIICIEPLPSYGPTLADFMGNRNDFAVCIAIFSNFSRHARGTDISGNGFGKGIQESFGAPRQQPDFMRHDASEMGQGGMRSGFTSYYRFGGYRKILGQSLGNRSSATSRQRLHPIVDRGKPNITIREFQQGMRSRLPLSRPLCATSKVERRVRRSVLVPFIS